MSNKILTGLLAATTAFSSFAIADVAQADQLNQDLYDLFRSEYVQTERDALENPETHRLEPGSLVTTGGDVDLFFLTEGATYINRLLYSVNGGGLGGTFDDRQIASNDRELAGFNNDTTMTLGEGETLGSFAEGSVLDFFLHSRGYWEGHSGWMLGADESQNADGLQHIAAYDYFDGTDSWVILSFEDMLGDGSEGSNMYKPNDTPSDRDFNDAVFAIRGVTRGTTSTPVPEPTATLALFGLAAAGFTGLRRRNKASK
ncbi:DUF4114 domain-containing protein [Lusitaniella coriacea LEGE 07157]|uniref:DUF4114 domain-containing protein n=1 Tax=Lusitaniella coriacea LEGE 07157 TaxID=945747 RepID=A0A8J7E283_9CYAN|nr:DUF4114 domain-containing protein [Lusitaniella coriacea]MBE9118331.1 DUF4114 domain-containing protein [Lusitaniella coriacea LEGE 07157]